MNAIDLLEKDHAGAKKAMNQLPALKGAEKKALFMTLKGELELHDRIEEDIFYPAVVAHPGCAGLSAGDKAAHASVEAALAKLEKLAIEDASWQPTFDGMQKKLSEHIADEEGNLFVKIRQAIKGPELDALGAKMAAEKDRHAQKV